MQNSKLKNEFRFVVLPAKEVSTRVCVLAKKFAEKLPHYFVVDGKRLFPHITLFKARIPTNRLVEFYNVIKYSVKQLEPAQAEVSGLKYHSHSGWLDIEIGLSKELLNIRKTILKFVRQNSGEPIRLKQKFRPHITLTKYKNRMQKRFLTHSKIIFPNCLRLQTIAVGLSDQYGQVFRILKKYKIK